MFTCQGFEMWWSPVGLAQRSPSWQEGLWEPRPAVQMRKVY